MGHENEGSDTASIHLLLYPATLSTSCSWIVLFLLHRVALEEVKAHLEPGTRIVMERESVSGVRLDVDLNRAALWINQAHLGPVGDAFAVATTDEELELGQHEVDRPSIFRRRKTN